MRRPRIRLSTTVLGFALLAAACSGGGDVATPSSIAEPAAADEPPAVVDSGTDVPLGSIVVLGDSIMAWNEESGRSIPDVIEQALGVPVENAAVGGAFAAEVPEQFERSDSNPTWVVFDGGGNDLNDFCGCGECAAVHDGVVSADGRSGVLAEFTDTLVERGLQVAVVGYYELPDDAAFGFDRCIDDLEEHNDRLSVLADRHDGVIFVDPSQVVGGDDREAFDDDLVHPSVAGSRLVGEQIAAAISATGG